MKVKSFEELVREAEKHDDYWEFGLVLSFLEGLVERMERQGISRAELARRLGTSPAYVTKILRGNANFTLLSLVKLARAVDGELVLSFRDRSAKTRSRSKPLPAAGGASAYATKPTARAAGGSASRSRRS